MLYFGDLTTFHNLSFTGAGSPAVFPYASSVKMTGLEHRREASRHCNFPSVASLGRGVPVTVQRVACTVGDIFI